MLPDPLEPPAITDLHDKRLFRVARAENPFYWSEISAEDSPRKHAGNRFDVPGHGVLYFASSLEGAYAETLARFRPSPAIRKHVAEQDPHFMMVGGVPRDGRDKRTIAEAILRDPLPFLDVESPHTHEVLTTALATELVDLGEGVIDVASVRGRNRLLTRAIASWAFDQRDAAGHPIYGGLRYLSRVDTRFECWAVFAGAEFRETKTSPIDPTASELVSIAELYKLRVF
ncbi:RES family NAD+ phosphorylase [Nesterenkonia sandarakina]|uniref:RES domain-containing protein n=1 Tax=Nesterenkonia sandarakina TaxID=272918 RepID=A0A7Z0J4B6_9MICC|nr:RES family NAD+ phosphorylase [Nesterenkonia sandarakina]NYJ18185.1 hypothetical protein [Nesterenkonia sandarakina]